MQEIKGYWLHTPSEDFAGYNSTVNSVVDRVIDGLSGSNPDDQEIISRLHDRIEDIVGMEIDIVYFGGERDWVFDKNYDSRVRLRHHSTGMDDPSWGVVNIEDGMVYREEDSDEIPEPDLIKEKVEVPSKGRSTCPECLSNKKNLGGHKGSRPCRASQKSRYRTKNCLQITMCGKGFKDYLKKEGEVVQLKTRYVPGGRNRRSSLEHRSYCEPIYLSKYRHGNISSTYYDNGFEKIAQTEKYIGVYDGNEMYVFRKLEGGLTRKRKFRMRPPGRKLYTTDGDLFGRRTDLDEAPSEIEKEVAVELM